MKPEQAEIERLKKEVAKLKMERDILKKAAVNSDGHCNTFGECSGRSAVSEALGACSLTCTPPWSRTLC